MYAASGAWRAQGRASHALCLAGSPMGWPSYLCSVLCARAPVLGLCFFVSVKRHTKEKPEEKAISEAISSTSVRTNCVVGLYS